MFSVPASRRDHYREERAQQNDAYRRRHHDCIDVDSFDPVHVVPGTHQPFQSAPRQQQSQPATGGRQQEALHQSLTQQTQPPAAQRGTNRQLFAPRSSAHHQQAGHVETGDQQHAAGRGQQCVERSLIALDRVIEHRAATDRFANPRLGMAHPDLRLHRIQTAEQSGKSRARQQASDHQEFVVRIRAHQPRRRLVGNGSPHLHILAAKRAGVHKGRRHDADHCIGARIEPDFLAHDCRITAVSPFPEGRGKDDGSLGAGPVVLRRKAAPDGRRNPERGEEIPRAPRGVYLFGKLSCLGRNVVSLPWRDQRQLSHIRR